MADKFDPYREALIMETITIWPDDLEISPNERKRIEDALHSDAEQCADLVYVRTHSGFCRQITITDADLERVG